jgi:hypothetical protein
MRFTNYFCFVLFTSMFISVFFLRLESLFFDVYRSIRVHFRAEAIFVRDTEDGDIMRVPAFFSTMPQDVNAVEDLDFDALASEFSTKVENWNARGSGFSLDRIVKFTVCVTKFRPLHGSSYLETPDFLAKKYCIVNVQNDDDKCFVWAVLSCLYPPANNAQRLSQYIKYEQSLNVDGLKFPLELKSIPKFESLNPAISVNVLYYDFDTREFCIEYLSPERNRDKHVNLLLLENEDSSKRHYVWIKNMSRLVAGRTKHNGATHVCDSCLQAFSSERVLTEHMPYCLRHHPQVVKYPDPENEEERTIKYKAHRAQFRIPFYLVCDFESFLVPVEDDYGYRGTRVIEEHEVSGFACHRVTHFECYQTDPVVYSGPDVMDKFYEHVLRESQIIANIIDDNKKMLPLTLQQQKVYDEATSCSNCGTCFTDENRKVRHHCHLTGNFLFPCCNNCNLQLKPKRRRVAKNKSKNNKKQTTEEWAEEQYQSQYFLPVIFHNLKCYDAHFVVKHFKRKYGEITKKPVRDDDDDSDDDTIIPCDQLRVIPLNSEKYMMFEVGYLRFLDSFQFLSTSLENLVSLLLKSGKDKFVHTTKYLGDSDLVFAKGVYPYSYMTDREKFNETTLPPIESFFDKLNDEPLDSQDYSRACSTWNHFGIQNMQEYHDHYLLSDVLLLTDVFENFRESIFGKHGLDCLHFYTLPSLAWAIALKLTEVKLDLITDPAAYLLIENSMRGGIATVSQRYSRANNPDVDGYDEADPRRYITFLDCNNLYGAAMSEPLPVGEFRFLDDVEVQNFDLLAVAPDAEVGYIIECDMTYPSELHESHNDYPMAPEHFTVTEEMLSPFAKSFNNQHWKPSVKLIPNLLNKTKYVAHYRNLQFYVTHGLVVDKIHRILSFTQSPWLAPWIDYCTTERQMASSEFEADLAKLKANATFGKTLEQVRNRQNVRLIANENSLAKAVSKVTFRQSEIINEDLCMVRASKRQVTLNKPIAVGFAILELSKLIMYRFYYDFLKQKYDNRCSLLFTDTDSFCCEIQTNDMHADMYENLSLFDTSNFETTHPLYSSENHRVLGKFKSETGSLQASEFVGLRAKMYSLRIFKSRKSTIKAKGIKKQYVRKNMRHEHFIRVLHSQAVTTCTFKAFRSRNHKLQTVEITKRCLDAFDDKRFILNDGVHTLAYGHKDIPSLI